MELLRQLQTFSAWNAQEAQDRDAIVHLLQTGQDFYTRDNPTAHLTASAWVVNPDGTKVLMAYHKLFQSWSWLGGHADGERDLLAVALREVREESGLSAVTPVVQQPFSTEILAVNGHEKRGQYVPSHLHLNITYLLQADDMQPLRCKPDENSAVAWFTPGDAIAASTEAWMQQRVYQKLNEKLHAFFQK